MSVVVKGMDVPKNCVDCYIENCGICRQTGKVMSMSWTSRLDRCPLVELPEHYGRLIDADALMNIFADCLVKISERYGINSAVAGAVAGAMKLLDLQPTVLEKE